jgi:hypothetical protein
VYATPTCAVNGAVQDKVKVAGETTKFVTACVATTPALSVTCNVNE